jgi:class 3 adenylate cyclase
LRALALRPEHALIMALTDLHFWHCVATGFTRIAALMSPDESMHLLDRLFQRFDSLATLHSAYKVETIGDSYFAVVGMLPPRPDHARVALRFAMDLHAAAAATLLPASALVAGGGSLLPHVQIRVGVNSGPVTSGVIGTLRARFCVFGDAVNTASRMESTGRADCVQLSSAAFCAAGLPPSALRLMRLDVKGKGIMETHLVNAFGAEAAGLRALLAAPMQPPTPHAGNAMPVAAAATPVAAAATSAAAFSFAPQPGDGVTTPCTPSHEHPTALSRCTSTAGGSSCGSLDLMWARERMSDVALLSGSQPSSSFADGLELGVSTRSSRTGPRALVATALPRAQSALAAALFTLLLAATTPRAALLPLLLKLAAIAALSAVAAARIAPFAPRSDAQAAASSTVATQVMSRLHVALALAHSEADILRSGADATMALFPGAVACALGVFAEGAQEGSGAAVSWLECGGDDGARAALAATLADTSAAAGEADDDGRARVSSVSRACRQDSAAWAPLDSRLLPGGMDACRDWSASASLGLNAAAAVTAKLVAGHVTVGFVQLYFGLFSGRAAPRAEASELSALADAVAGAIFVRRALAINPETEYNAAVAAFAAPSGRMSDPRLTRLQPGDAAMVDAAARDDAALFELLDASAADDHTTLMSWGVDPWALPDAEVRRLMMAMMHSLGVLRRFQIRPTAFAAFIQQVAAHYNDNPFHSFNHAWIIMHACWLFLTDLSLRNGLLEELDVLALLLAAICHDAEHPGTTNAYQVNTGSELALRYNGA